MYVQGSVKFVYQSKNIGQPYQVNSSYPDLINDQTITMEVPMIDMNVHQYFNLFNSFLRALNFDELTIMRGAVSSAFNDIHSLQNMKSVAEEYDLKMNEDYNREVQQLKSEILDLKAKLSRFKNPNNPNYTEEEMEALCAENEITVQTLLKANVVCGDCGQKYGKYSVGCSSFWTGKCNVCGQEKSVTEVRDFGYLQKGIDELSK